MWTVEVGLPNMTYWNKAKAAGAEPDMSNVGKKLGSLPEFKTRQEARDYASVLSDGNKAWFYRATRL